MMMARMAAAGLSLLLAGTAQAESCLPLNGAATLIGTLSRRVFPGPPNYRSVQQGDRAESYWFIDLDTTVCVGSQSGLSSFQLVVLPMQQQQGAAYLGNTARVTGVLLRAGNPHQHTPVVVQVTGIGNP